MSAVIKTSSTKHYPKELKERTVNLLNEGVPRQELIDKLNLHPTTLSSWKHGPRKKVPSFSKAIIVEDNPEIKVTVVTGLKLSDLKGLLQ
ncbi:MAG: transposase [Bdellovibrionales bacterium]|nr:transposase [Bdellovibrionales bacterium]NQZ20247.1 transposase [Bdellovibrionales bacterium]